jgi:phosphatidylglycerophosphate synthase
VDPFVDKVLVLGSFIFFAGKNFIIPEPQQTPYVVKTITGVAPGIVVILLCRELLVTSIRGTTEGSGKSFGAVWSGKLKMGFQSGTILAILLYVNYYDWLVLDGHRHYERIARGVRDLGIWGTVAITLFSGVTYILRAIAMSKEERTG